MYIFVEPVTEAQIKEIQSRNDAKIEEFERNLLGLHGGAQSLAENDQDEDGKWADIEASVQEAMAKDELSVLEAKTDEEPSTQVPVEVIFNSDHQGNLNEVPVSVDVENEDEEDMTASTGAGDNEIDTKDDEGPQVEEGGYEGNEGNERPYEAVENDEGETSRKADEDEVKRGEEENKELQGTGNQDQCGGVDAIAEAENANSEQSQLGDSDTTSADEDRQQAPTDETPSFSGASPTANFPTINNQDHQGPPNIAKVDATEIPEELSDIKADSPTPDIISSDGTSPEESEIFALTLTIRNKVNNEYIARPDSLNQDDDWTVEYALAEVPSAKRAWSLYRACQTRRMKRLDSAPEDEEDISYYVKELREMSRKGAIWRRGMDEKDKSRTKAVAWEPLPQEGDSDGRVKESPEK